MPFKYIRKRDNFGKTEPANMREAVKCVLEGESERKVAQRLKIPRSTLQRYVAKGRAHGADVVRMSPNYANAKIFTENQEKDLVRYIQTASRMHHGLTTDASRELAYQFAKKNQLKTPDKWDDNKTAGIEWLRGFLQRHQELSIRSPEATSIGRATSFNRETVNKFYVNLETVMDRYKFPSNRIYNIDETGLMTVHKPPKVIASKGEKQVGQITSGERGQLVTLVGAINAVGNSIPPLLIFPRVNFRNHMLNGAPPGTIGAANPSGWINAELFESWLDHFITHSQSTKDSPTLLIMDNHTSHISVAVIDKAKANGVVLLTFPPHTSHKLQPLDRTVYGPLKKYFHEACNDWMLSNHGKLITIYEMAQCLGKSFPRAFKPENIVSGFRATGISPYDRNVFSDNEFLSSYVTDRPQVPVAEDNDGEQEPPAEQHPLAGEQQPTTQHPLAGEQQSVGLHPLAGEQQPTTQQPPAGEQQPVGLHPSVEHLPLDAHQSPVGQNMQQACCNSSTDQQNENRYWSPEDLRPYPKAGPRKATKRKTSK